MRRFGWVLPGMLILLLACGSRPDRGPSSGNPPGGGSDADSPSEAEGDSVGTASGTGGAATIAGIDQALSVPTRKALPKCGAEGLLAYVADEHSLYACLNGSWAEADLSAAGVVGPQGPAGDPGRDAPQCKWCSDGESTIPYDAATSLWSIYTCGKVGADGCGEWILSKHCQSGETPKSIAAATDANGLAARYPFPSYECVDPTVGQPKDECVKDADCADASWQCTYSSPRECVAKASWATGSGTWDYNSDHFTWSVGSSSTSASCTWPSTTYWFETLAKCSVYFFAIFDAPDGGLQQAYFSFDVTASSKVGDVLTGKGYLYTNTTAAAHQGSVLESADQISLTAVDMRQGGSITGNWKLEGTVASTNKLKTSGQFKIVLPNK